MTSIRPLVLYHASCLDGFAAAFAAYLALGDDVDYRAVKYGELTHPADVIDLVDGRRVYILDFSFPVPIMETILRQAGYVVWLDHHASSFKAWCGPDYLTDERQEFVNRSKTCLLHLDNTKSGALLAWEFFHPDEGVPYGYQLIDDYDRWQFKYDDTRAFQKALWSYGPFTVAQWADMYRAGNFDKGSVGYDRLISEGKALLRAHEQQVRAVVNAGARGCVMTAGAAATDTLATRYGKAANCPPHLTSDVGHALACMSGTYGLCWYLGFDGKVNCSLRSDGDYDVSVIAEELGGGGHKNAAGFTTDIGTLINYLVL